MGTHSIKKILNNIDIILMNLNVKVSFGPNILENLNFDSGTYPTQKILNLKKTEIIFDEF